MSCWAPAWLAAQTQVPSSQQPRQHSSLTLLNPTNNKVKVLWEQTVELSTNNKTEPQNCSVSNDANFPQDPTVYSSTPAPLPHVNTDFLCISSEEGEGKQNWFSSYCPLSRNNLARNRPIVTNTWFS